MLKLTANCHCLLMLFFAVALVGCEPELPSSDLILRDALNNKQSDLQVLGSGEIIRILSDDNEGSRHQRFVVELATGQTLLVAHNIDLAPRVSGIMTGTDIEFYGEYEWNSQGGVIHWTHHDPAGRHVDGWLKYKDITYQ